MVCESSFVSECVCVCVRERERERVSVKERGWRARDLYASELVLLVPYMCGTHQILIQNKLSLFNSKLCNVYLNIHVLKACTCTLLTNL